MSPVKMSRIESVMRVVLAFNEARNQHDVAAMLALMSEDCVFENTSPAPDGSVYRGKQEIQDFWEGFFLESPKAKFKIEDIFGLGRHCVMRWRYDWGDGHVRGVDVNVVEGELIKEVFSYVKG